MKFGVRFRRLAAAVAALGITSAAAVGVVVVDAPAAHGADSRAVVVVDTGGGVRRSVVSFSGSITGLQALQLAGANPVTYGFAGQGTAVCALDGVGHDATQGSCLGTLDDPRYWAYFRSAAGSSGWTYSRGCACTAAVHDGDVEGWQFGTGQAPPYSSFCSVAGCAPPPTPPPTAAPAAPPPSVAGTVVTAPPAGAGRTGSGGSATGAGGGKGTVTTAPGSGASSDPPAAGSSTTAGRSGSRSGTKSGSSSGGGSDQRALPAGTGGSSGGGSPWGVVGAVVLVAGLAGGAWWLRRSRVARARPG